MIAPQIGTPLVETQEPTSYTKLATQDDIYFTLMSLGPDVGVIRIMLKDT